MKIELDKYYTPIEVANHYWEIVAKSAGLSDEVFDICNEVIRLKSEE